MKTDSSSTDTTIVAKLENIYKIYKMGTTEVKALAGLTLSFKRGNFWAIMGPSGSGKSTLMNILGCLDRPSSGRYVLQNKNVSTLNDSTLSNLRLEYIGFIFQSFNLIPQLNVQKNIELPLYYLGWDADKSAERAKKLAAMVGLETRLNHRPTELSGGQMQRVAIARALANDPHILLADEPTGNLDSKTGDQILDILTELNEQGKTIIMVTHEQYVAGHTKQQLHMKDGLIDEIHGES